MRGRTARIAACLNGVCCEPSRRSACPALLALTLVATAPAGPENGGALSVRAAKPTLQPLASLDHSGHGHKLVTVAWASGRAWFMVGSAQGLTIASARPGRNGLTAHETARIKAPFSWYPLVAGSDVLYSTSKSTSGVARLRSNGKIDPPTAASPEPMATKRGIPVAAARLGDRLIWALAGGVQIGDGLSFRPTLGACCDESGAASDLTSLITSRPAPRNHVLGVDGQGRPWLAWLDKFGRAAQVRVVQLDPVTLARTTPKALVAPVANALGLQMACAKACRLVIVAGERNPRGGFSQYLASWAPGERAATRLRLPPDSEDAHLHPQLVAAAYRSGRLAVAYMQTPGGDSRSLNVVVGDARGANARLRGSVELPERYSGLPMWSLPLGAFTPSGFAVALTYSNWGTRVHAAATVVPLR